MASIIRTLLPILAVVAAAAAAPEPPAVEWSPAANKSISALYPKLAKAFEGVNAAAPPGKKSEVENATVTQVLVVTLALAQAKDKGDEKKAVALATSYEIAADLVIGAPPAEKFQVMEESFNAVAAPNPIDCPKVDKAYCKTYAKVQKALDAVAAAAPAAKKLDTKDAILKKGFARALGAINKAYAQGDDKEIARVLAAYRKAAHAVIAAPPAEKFKVMEETFAAAATTAAHPSKKESAHPPKKESAHPPKKE